MKLKTLDEPCFVSPSPELAEKIKEDLAKMREAAPSSIAALIRVRDKSPPGMNDGLIYPGETFELGTTASVARRAAAVRSPIRGTVNVVVVLVDFEDKTMTKTKQDFEQLFFSSGIMPNGSVREYYKEVSNNIINIEGMVVGPYRLPRVLSEYAHGDYGTSMQQPNARTMAQDAAIAADPDVDYSLYDNDRDGYVDAFIVIHAGEGAESTGNPGDIWSHKWVLPSVYNADGSRVYAYLTVPEDAKIGVCCHELGHLLFGFIDLYDIDYSSEGVGNWCLMGGGSWNGGGEVPAHPSAHCKAQQKWVSVITHKKDALINIEAVENSKTVHRLWKNGKQSDEYFLVENRQKTLFDRELPGEGILIWHVDEAIDSNTNENHPQVSLEQADGRDDLTDGVNRGDTGDPYPGSSFNRTFDESSNPNSKSYGNRDSCVSLTNISNSGSSMKADLKVKGKNESSCFQLF